MKYITYIEAMNKTGISRSTIMRRAKALGIIPVRLKNNKQGTNPVAITEDQLQIILDFIPESAKVKKVYKTPKQKSDSTRKFVSWTPSPNENREKGYYMTIQPYEMLGSFQGGRV